MIAAVTTPQCYRALSLAALAVSAAMAGCSRPEWTDPERSKGSRALPPPGQKPAIPTSPLAGPQPAAWVAPLLGRPLRQAFARDGVCMGNTDAIHLIYEGAPRAATLVGWAWEFGPKAPVPRVVVADAAGVVVGGGDAGVVRTDVPTVMPVVTSDRSGWEAITTVVTGRVNVFGVVEGGQAICPLGGADF